jgi:glycosyltransferase involved in cell wall biosynthesis
MRILQLTSHLNVGGVTSYVLSLSEALARRGHEVTIASDGGQREGEARRNSLSHWQVPLHTSQEFSPQVFRAARLLRDRLMQQPVDVVHAHTRVAQVVAARLSRHVHCPYVATWHGFFRQNLGRWLWPCSGDATIAISEPVRDHLLRTFRVPAARVHLIPNGIDPRPFESPVDAASVQRLREQVGLPADGPVVGTVARLVRSKRVDALIRSFSVVRQRLPDARLLIVGDGAQRSALERLAAERGVQDAVHFAGSLPETRVAFSLMRVFVFLPAEQEGFGLSLLEAMASARPIVAVRRGIGAPWVLERSGVGLIVEPGDESGLAAAIIQLLQDGGVARREADKARAVVKERYSLERMVDHVEEVYREVRRDISIFR